MAARATAPARARYGVLGFTLLLSAIAYLDRVCISTAAPAMTDDLGLTKAQMGCVFTAFSFACAVMEVPAGWLADRFGPRLMLTRVVIWWSLAWLWWFRDDPHRHAGVNAAELELIGSAKPTGEVTRSDNAETVAAVHDRRSGSTMKAGGQRPPLRVWEVNPSVKVFPDDLPGPAAKTVTVECARNEHEPFQLVLRSNNGLGCAELEVSPLKNDKGGTLPPVKVEQVGFVPIDHPSGYFHTDVADWQRRVPRGRGSTDGWAGEWPDPLMPNGRFAVLSDRAQPLWFTVHVPREAAPGEYRGTVSIRDWDQMVATVPMRVKALPFELPKSTRLKTVFDFRFHGDEALAMLAELVEKAKVAGLTIERAAFAAGNDTIKVALVGCGGRGSGAAAQALSTRGPVKLWAMADLFADRLEASLLNLMKSRQATYDRDLRGYVPPIVEASGGALVV